MTPIRGDRLLRLSSFDLQQRIGFKEATIRKLVREGRLQAINVQGILLIADSEVDRFIDAAKSENTNRTQ